MQFVLFILIITVITLLTFIVIVSKQRSLEKQQGTFFAILKA